MSDRRINLEEPAICPRCGGSFHCSTSGKCWCYEWDIPAKQLEEIERRWQGCLCPSCLAEYLRQGKSPENG